MELKSGFPGLPDHLYSVFGEPLLPLLSKPEGFNRSAAPVQSFPPWEEDIFIRQLLCSNMATFSHFTLITTQEISDYYPHVTDEEN